MANIFNPIIIKGIPLNNRIVMAPMTRARCSQPGNLPNILMAEYYAQRATAGLIISEATQVSEDAQGYSSTPGIYTNQQLQNWKIVTSLVHAKGSKIFNQLWHAGRVSHPSLLNGQRPIAPSAIKPQDTYVWIANEDRNGEMVACVKPREMCLEDIRRVVGNFADAAEKSIEAGFDGVEIQGGNGYLIDQFLRTCSNTRTDCYGGNKEKRSRFLLEVVDAVANRIGVNRTAVRLSPYVTRKDMSCPDIVSTTLDLAIKLQLRDIAYLHLSEADWNDAPEISDSFRAELRHRFSNCIIVAGRYDLKRASRILEKGYADLVAFGRAFIANPDLVRRMQFNMPLAKLDPTTLFGGGEYGYCDYPRYVK
ncbi:alkene reductase [Vibrio sp. NTOU-M3]|uniref:alkene reductase n=1 Tax=Vibrio sp. NTOU-M3 TaxID=3234954 RepID=UPI00349F0824